MCAYVPVERCVYIAVEIDVACQRLMRTHWDDDRDGTLIQLADVRDLAAQDDVLGSLQELVGLDVSIDLCIGGWPCNNLSGYNRASGVNGRRGLDGSKSSLLFALSEVVTKLCAQPFFGSPCDDDGDPLPAMTKVTVVQKRQEFRATVIESVRRPEPSWTAAAPAAAADSDSGTRNHSAAILWYRVRFESVPEDDDSKDMWFPGDAVFTQSSVDDSGPAAINPEVTNTDASVSASSASADSETGKSLCAHCKESGSSTQDDETLLHCEGCYKHWHASCMRACHPAASQWERTDEGASSSEWARHWFCHECVHPVPTSRSIADASNVNRAATSSTTVVVGEDPDGIACNRCRRLDDAEQMILCDGCDEGFHMFCLDPPLKSIPEGDWLCPRCLSEYVASDMSGSAPQLRAEQSNPSGGDRPALSAEDLKEVELAVLQLTATVQRAAWRETLAIGDTCVCIDVNRVWYEARIVGSRGGGLPEQFVGSAAAGRYLVPHSIDSHAKGRGSSRQLLIHFAGWHQQWDEWVSVFSDRIQPAGSQSLKQSHSQSHGGGGGGTAQTAVNRTSRGKLAAGRLAEVLRKQRGAPLPVFEPEGLALEAELLAEEQWKDCRCYLGASAQVSAVLGAVIRTVEAIHLEERRIQAAHAAAATARALEVRRVAEAARRQAERDERDRLRLLAANKKRDEKIARSVASVLKRLVGRVVTDLRNETMAAQRLAREQEQLQRRLLNEERRRQQQQRHEALELTRAVRAALSAVVTAVELAARQEAEVSKALGNLLQRVERNLMERPTLALALSRGWLQEGQRLEVLWDDPTGIDASEAAAREDHSSRGSAPGQRWYAAKVLALPPPQALAQADWHQEEHQLVLAYPIDGTEYLLRKTLVPKTQSRRIFGICLYVYTRDSAGRYEEERFCSWAEIKKVECWLRSGGSNGGRPSADGLKGNKRVRSQAGSPAAKRSRPSLGDQDLAASALGASLVPLGGAATITTAEQQALTEENRELRKRNELMLAELQVC